MNFNMSVTGAKQLATKLDRIGRADLRRSNINSTEASARTVERDLKEKRFSGDPIHARSGITRASIRTQVNRSNNPSATVGSPIKHIGVLEDGKVIRAKRRKYLTIPLAAARTGAGKSRGTARQVGAQYQSTYVRKTKRGNLILFGVRGRRQVPLFVLKRSVKIPARHAFLKSARATRLGIVRRFESDIGRMLK